MTRSVTLDARQRPAWLDRSRTDRDPDVRFRAHILVLVADGPTWATVATLLVWSSRTLDRGVKRFHQEGVEGLAGHQPGRPVRRAAGGVAVVVAWVTTTVPRDFGLLRSRGCGEVVALLRRELHQVEVRRATVRRGLQRGNLVDRRPRPLLGPTDEQREKKRDELRTLLAEWPEDETAVFQDEVDINTHPTSGAMGRGRGEHATVQTPGNNAKR
jgi:Homeodomain-like domain